MNEAERRFEMLKSHYSKEIADKYATMKVCEKCGNNTGDLWVHVHHLKAIDAPDRNSLDSVIGLCYYCHRMVHKNDRRKRYKKGNTLVLDDPRSGSAFGIGKKGGLSD